MNREDKYFIFDREKKKTPWYYIKYFLNFFRAGLYKILMSTNRINDTHQKKYDVSICAIFKNEAAYLCEWIEFNHLVGINHFYMYNNNSSDDYKSVLDPYVNKGWVTLIDWPYNQKQIESYKDCINKYSSETKWLGFIDIDEFIIPKSTDNIYDFLKQFELNRGAVTIYWKLFGSSGLVDRAVNRLVTEDFTVCWPKYCDIGKCFYNTRFGFDPASTRGGQLHHRFWAHCKGKDIPPVNVFDHVCIGNKNAADSDDFPIQINHYFTKSFREYISKCSKGDVYFKVNPHDEQYFYEHEMKCTSVDFSAYKYLTKLKLQMGLLDGQDK